MHLFLKTLSVKESLPPCFPSNQIPRKQRRLPPNSVVLRPGRLPREERLNKDMLSAFMFASSIKLAGNNE